MQGGDADSEECGDAGGKRRAENSHSQGIKKHIIQHDIGGACKEHGAHGQFRIAVVADKSHQKMIEYKRGRKTQNGFQIGVAHIKSADIRAKKHGNRSGKEKSDKGIQESDHRRGQKRHGEGGIRLPIFVSGTEDRVSRRASDAEQQPCPVHQTEYAHGQIHRRQAVGTQFFGHEKGIGKNGSRRSDHSQNAHRNIFPKFFFKVVHFRTSALFVRKNSGRLCGRPPPAAKNCE